MRKRKKYYHKTIVLKDIFSNMAVFTTVIVFTVGIFMTVIGRLDISPSNSFIVSKFDRLFLKNDMYSINIPNVYDCIIKAVPSIKSSEEMTKKYSAKYGGIKKNSKKSENEKTPVVENNIKEIDMSAGGIAFRNETAYTPDAAELMGMALSFGETPTVLIVHTHTSEAYAESEGARSTDNSKNVVRIGEVLGKELKRQGVNVVHDTTRNDYPSYNGSYNKALGVIEKNILKNPSIEIVLDIHRDYAEQKNNGESVQLKPVTKIGGENVAQVMFVVGTDANGLTHPDWKHNLSFAVKIQSELEKIAPKVARPINLRRERFNQHKTGGSLIVEMGTAGNTVSENERAAVYVARALASVLKNR